MGSGTNDKITAASMTDGLRTEILAEWNALRAEIVKRMEIRHQIVTLTLIVAGTLITFGAREGAPVLVLLLYPLLAVFLAMAWMHNDMRISEAGEFIQNEIEKVLPGLRWEGYISEKKAKEIRTNPLAKATELSANGVFVFTQLLAIALSFDRMNFAVYELTLLIIDFCAVLLTVYYIRRRRSLYRQAVPKEIAEQGQ